MSGYFFAIAPAEPTLSLIESFRARWGHPHHRVEPHITVKAPFQWNGPAESFLAPVQAACAGLSPFEVRLGPPARFGDAVLYLTVHGPGLPLLHRTVLEAVSPFAPPHPGGHEGETYTPHLTLAVTRFGVSPEGLGQMEGEALRELSGFPPFVVNSLRCYHREGKDDRWLPLCDLPLTCAIMDR